MSNFRLYAITDGRQPIVDTELYKEFFRESQAFAAILDSTGHIRELNGMARGMTGLGSDDPEEIPIWDLPAWTEESRHVLRTAVIAVANGEIFRGISEVRTTAGGSAKLDVLLRRPRGTAGATDTLIMEARSVDSASVMLEPLVSHDLAALAAHDLNNLLTGIAGNLELVVRWQQEEIAQKRLKRAMHGVFRGHVLIELIDGFARQALAVYPVDLAEKLREAQEECRKGLHGEADLTTVFDEGLWRCFGDAKSLSAALLHLMVHIYDSARSEGRLEVRVENVTLENGSAGPSSGLAPGDYVVVTAARGAAGSGHSTRILPEDSWEQANVGFGLWSVRAIARRTGGDLVVGHPCSSDLIARLYLPRAAAGG